MRQLTYHGPGHMLRLPSGRQVARGQTGEVTNHDAAVAQRSKRQQVTVAGENDAGDDTGDTPEADGEGHPDTDPDRQE